MLKFRAKEKNNTLQLTCLSGEKSFDVIFDGEKTKFMLDIADKYTLWDGDGDFIYDKAVCYPKCPAEIKEKLKECMQVDEVKESDEAE